MLNRTFSQLLEKAGLYCLRLSGGNKKISFLIKHHLREMPTKNLGWSELSYYLVLDYFKKTSTPCETEHFIEKLIEIEKFNADFFNGFLYNQGFKNWVDALVENHHSHKYAYSCLLSSSRLSNKNKSAIELKLLKQYMEKDCLFSFQTQERTNLSGTLSQISDIISREYIFKNSITSFRSLLWIFSNPHVTENINPKRLLLCLDNFAAMGVLAKKVIFKNLIKKKQETIILNLFNKGIDLNWMIDFDGEGLPEVCSLKILENLKLSDVLLSHSDWNILAQNSAGDNILHIMAGSSLLENSNLQKLKSLILKLSPAQKDSLLSHTNAKGLTPMSLAILYQDADMIDFLLDNGVSKWATEHCPLEFINHCISGDTYHLLPEQYQQIEIDPTLWYSLKRRWESEKSYLELENSLEQKQEHKKVSKI